MSYLADLHVHSHHSRATSRACTLEGLHRWAQLKGVRVVGTGDCTHPGWLAELRERLQPAHPGLYRLRRRFAAVADRGVPASCRGDVQFLLTGEVSSVWRRDGRVRRMHSLVLLPDLASAARLQRRLAAVGNIASDGRPILRLDPRDLLESLLACHPAAVLIPAHIWTPWYSLLGACSGFDSLDACFGPLTRHIPAVETGLSSDPPMNWRIRSLARVALVSNSDLHSPAHLGRNANLFHGEPDYFAMLRGLAARDPAVCGGTIDLFPEAGKYHLDGHRACGFVCEPAESRRRGNRCPVCGRSLTLGVLHRVNDLANRPVGRRPAGALPYRSIIPLAELLAELLQAPAGGRRVADAYLRLLRLLGPEMAILLDCPPAELEAQDLPRLGEAIRAMRASRVRREGGYDGVYGSIRVFPRDQPAARARRRVPPST